MYIIMVDSVPFNNYVAYYVQGVHQLAMMGVLLIHTLNAKLYQMCKELLYAVIQCV